MSNREGKLNRLVASPSSSFQLRLISWLWIDGSKVSNRRHMLLYTMACAGKNGANMYNTAVHVPPPRRIFLAAWMNLCSFSVLYSVRWPETFPFPFVSRCTRAPSEKSRELFHLDAHIMHDSSPSMVRPFLWFALFTYSHTLLGMFSLKHDG